MNNVSGLYCLRCDFNFPFVEYGSLCPVCESSVEMKMDFSNFPTDLKQIILSRPQSGLLQWKEFLPFANLQNPVTLGEGNTALIPGGRLATDLKLPYLFFKAEHMLPTGSLKDRSVAVAINHAVSLSYSAVAVSSTGNHAASVAAYAAAAGLKAFIFIPEKTDPAKVNQSAIHGATIIRVQGTMEDATRLLNQALKVFKWYPFLSSNPVRNEGKKTCAYEVWQQLGEKAPDFMVHPIAGGIGLWGAWKGFTELQQLNWSSGIPKMIGAQAEKAAPIGEAWKAGSTDSFKVSVSTTCAESIAISSVTPGVGFRTLHAIKNSGGSCVTVNESEIISARNLLAEKAGLFVEPSAATSLAALIQMMNRNEIQKHHNVVCVLTGTGLKQSLPANHQSAPVSIPAELPELQKYLSSLEGIR